MEILVGSDTGIIKRIDISTGKILNSFGNSKANNEVKSLEWLKYKEGFLIALTTSSLTIYKATESVVETYNLVNFEQKACSLIIDKIGRKIYVVFETGVIHLYSLKKMKLSFQFKICSNYSSILFDSLTIQPKSSLISTKINPFHKHELVLLFKGMNPHLIDLNEGKLIWKARNVKNDFLDLAVPIYDMDCEFYEKGDFIFTCTAYHKIRLYNLRKESSQPILDIEYSENSPFNHIHINSTFLYVSNNSGSIIKWSINNTNSGINLKLAGKYKPTTATIKGFELAKDGIDPGSLFLVSCGYDRYLVILEEGTKVIRKKIFIGIKGMAMYVPKSLLCPEEDDEEDNEQILKTRYKLANQAKTLDLGLYPKPDISDWQSESSLNSKKVKSK